mgnify:CR=1 FL=1
MSTIQDFKTSCIFLSLRAKLKNPLCSRTPCTMLGLPHLDLKFQIGTCYSRRECRTKNGTAVAQCAQGYGVCCICK